MLIPVDIYLFKVNNRNTRTRCEICSKLTIKIQEQREYFTPCSSVSIVNFEQVNADWDAKKSWANKPLFEQWLKMGQSRTRYQESRDKNNINLVF